VSNPQMAPVNLAPNLAPSDSEFTNNTTILFISTYQWRATSLPGCSCSQVSNRLPRIIHSLTLSSQHYPPPIPFDLEITRGCMLPASLTFHYPVCPVLSLFIPFVHYPRNRTHSLADNPAAFELYLRFQNPLQKHSSNTYLTVSLYSLQSVSPRVTFRWLFLLLGRFISDDRPLNFREFFARLTRAQPSLSPHNHCVQAGSRTAQF
jgi:hypothetical protein